MSTEPTNSYSGSCLCGAVRYEVLGALRPIIYCHCTQCRKTTGNFVASTASAAEDLTFMEDTGLEWYQSSPEAERGFCSKCGASLFWRPRTGDRVAIFAGTLDMPTGLKAVAHIFTADASDFLTIADGVQQYEGFGPAEMLSVRE